MLSHRDTEIVLYYVEAWGNVNLKENPYDTHQLDVGSMLYFKELGLITPLRTPLT